MATERASRRHTIPLGFLVGALAVAGPLLLAGPASAHPPAADPVPLRHHESFVGVVNGAASNAVIQMGCFGPLRPGQTGHPLSGQSVEVRLSAAVSGPGFTGQGNVIAAVLSYPTSRANPVATVLARFRDFDQPAAVSTALTLPCSGPGSVTFVPVNGGATARPATVTLTFEGQP